MMMLMMLMMMLMIMMLMMLMMLTMMMTMMMTMLMTMTMTMTMMVMVMMMMMMMMMMNKHCLGPDLFAEFLALYLMDLMTKKTSLWCVNNFPLILAKFQRWKSKNNQQISNLPCRSFARAFSHQNSQIWKTVVLLMERTSEATR